MYPITIYVWSMLCDTHDSDALIRTHITGSGTCLWYIHIFSIFAHETHICIALSIRIQFKFWEEKKKRPRKRLIRHFLFDIMAEVSDSKKFLLNWYDLSQPKKFHFRFFIALLFCIFRCLLLFRFSSWSHIGTDSLAQKNTHAQSSTIYVVQSFPLFC